VAGVGIMAATSSAMTAEDFRILTSMAGLWVRWNCRPGLMELVN
jgi:hypothetical protein